MKTNKPKALVLYSGGLDSILAIRLMQKQGIDVEAVNFFSPFCTCQKCFITEKPKQFRIKLHVLNKGKALLKAVEKPRFGYGSNVNPCLDCRVLIFKLAWKLAKKIGADFLVTGEVLDERPMSQNRFSMFRIEKAAGLEGKILRPLSAKLLPETEAEKKGLVDRSKLLAIRGRSRKPQMELAKKLKIGDYPCPAGGCLLTDPNFACRIREFLKHEKHLTFKNVEFLKLGRHFRYKGKRIIVGRNEKENSKLESLAASSDAILEVKGYMGPITIIKKFKGYIKDEKVLKFSLGVMIRYSDVPESKEVEVIVRYGKYRKLYKAKALKDEYLRKFKI